MRNHTAKLNLMKMKKGDRAFFYHSNVGKEIVGIVEIIREHHPDPTAKKGDPWVVVDIAAREPLPKPVSLDTIKTEPKLKDMALLKQSRLSVQPVTADEWKIVCKMGGREGVTPAAKRRARLLRQDMAGMRVSCGSVCLNRFNASFAAGGSSVIANRTAAAMSCVMSAAAIC